MMIFFGVKALIIAHCEFYILLNFTLVDFITIK